MRSESEANRQTFYAKRSEANSLRFAFFRINANSQCEFGPLADDDVFEKPVCGERSGNVNQIRWQPADREENTVCHIVTIQHRHQRRAVLF